MEAIDLNTDVNEPAAGAGFGERLVAAREARGLAHGDVVRVLRLPRATLQALESNCYEKLPAPVFVRGYLRAYARLLGMDGEKLVAEYDRLVEMHEPRLKPVTKDHRRTTTSDLYIRGGATLVMLAIMVLLGFWWYDRMNQDVPAQPRTASSEAEEPASSVSMYPPAQMDVANPNPGSVVVLDPVTPTQPPASDASEEIVAAVEPEAPLDDSAAQTAPALPIVNDSPITTNAELVDQSRDPAATVETAAVPDLPIAPLASERRGLVRASRAPEGEEVLVIKANDESWAEVVDANGYQILYYLLRPGVEHSLQGRAPFQVFLGNAPAVDLSLNQERFDHTPFHRRNSTARFSVDSHL